MNETKKELLNEEPPMTASEATITAIVIAVMVAIMATCILWLFSEPGFMEAGVVAARHNIFGWLL